MNNIFSEGTAMSSQRSLMRALGWTDSEMKKPIIGIICAQSDIIPGHMYLDRIAEAVVELRKGKAAHLIIEPVRAQIVIVDRSDDVLAVHALSFDKIFCGIPYVVDRKAA